MKKKRRIQDYKDGKSSGLIGRTTPRNQSPASKLVPNKSVGLKDRYITPNPLSPRAAKPAKGSTMSMVDRAGRLLGNARTRTPRKLFSLGGEPGPATSKITSIINSPRNTELRYAETVGTHYKGHGNVLDQFKVPQGVAANLFEKGTENMKRIKEIIAKNRRTKSSATPALFHPVVSSKDQNQPLAKPKMAWEEKHEHTSTTRPERTMSTNQSSKPRLIDLDLASVFRRMKNPLKSPSADFISRLGNVDNLLKAQARVHSREGSRINDLRKTATGNNQNAETQALLGRNEAAITKMKTHGFLSPKGGMNQKIKLEVKDLDKGVSAAQALISPKFIKKGLFSDEKPLMKPKSFIPPEQPKLVDVSLQDPVACFAVKTRAGCLPNKETKTNQDSYFCIRNFSNIKNMWLFGVFDGHGVNGHFASDHVKTCLPTNLELAEYISKKKDGISETTKEKGGLLSENQKTRQGIYRDAYLKTNEDIRNRSFNTSFSGTTVVTVTLIGNKLICANAGDSRAILASYKNPKTIKNIKLPPEFEQLPEDEKIWLALPLSRDHKPDDEEEYKRIISSRGRVEPFIEPTGEPVGPYRVWLRDENVPGLAMSRSVGDKVAQSVGVISDPELYETTLTPDDKFLILASDGIWEFLPNDQVVEMVVPYWENNDPEGACKRLIAESVYHWENEDEVIDDITLIVIFLSATQKYNNTTQLVS